MTRDEQLLLNLVRLKYREAPVFLEVTSISSQFVFEESASATGTLVEGATRVGRDQLQVDGGVGYSERPTITYAPLKGDEFIERLLSPMQLETLMTLASSGWSVDRVLRLTVQEINGLNNASSASGPTPDQVPPYAEFARVSKLLRELQKEGVASFGLESRWIALSGPVSTAALEAADLVDAAREGYRFDLSQEGRAFVLTGKEQKPVFQISPQIAAREDVGELIDMLGLKPGQDHYEIEVGLVDRPVDVVKEPAEILTIQPRSLMGAMFYLSQGIDVPQRHGERGYVTITRDEDGNVFDWTEIMGDQLQVHSQRTRPIRAAVAVQHRGYWFYIDEADLNSKTTFAMLIQLFELQAGQKAGTAPVLTLPVGG